MGAMELVVPALEGDVGRPWQSHRPKEWEVARLQASPVVHHGLDGVGRAGKLLLIGLAGRGSRGLPGTFRTPWHTLPVPAGSPRPPQQSRAGVASCHQDPWRRRKGRVVFSQRTTEHHGCRAWAGRGRSVAWAKWIAEQGLGSGCTHRRFRKSRLRTAGGHPGHFGAKPSTWSFSFWRGLGDKQRHHHILTSESLP